MRTEKKKLLVGAGAGASGLRPVSLPGRVGIWEISAAEAFGRDRSANPLYILLGIALIYLCFALRALRWKIFQRNLGKADSGSSTG